APLLAAASAGEETFVDIAELPPVLQDISVVVPRDVAFAAVRAAVLAGGGELLRSTCLIVSFEGEQIGADKVSLTLTLEFRAPDRTLTEAEVNDVRAAIKQSLEAVGGSLRE
ncbi:MAG: phenylalanine--tRNA ligase subunit beta, partial [Solirubrobacterales bacterium]